MECQIANNPIIRKMYAHPILSLIVIGLLIRIPISVFFTHSYDVKYWATILENLESGNELYGLPGYYYTPVWGYFLAVIGLFATTILDFGTLGTQCDAFVFAPGTDWGYYADLVADPWYSFIYKMVFTLCDLLISLLIYKIVIEYTSDRRKSTIAFAMWWMCPLIIYTSNVHVMFDSLPILITLLAVYFLLKDQYFFAGCALGIAALCKLFPAYLLFIFIAYIISKKCGNRAETAKGILSGIFGALLFTAIIMMPSIMDGNFIQSFGMVTNRVGEISSEGEGNVWDGLVSNGYFIVIILQPLIFLLEILIAVKMARTKEDRDRKFFQLAMLSATSIFLWTPTPTYLMLIVPFVILYTVICDNTYKFAYLVLTLSAVLYAIVMHNFSDLIQASSYFHIIPSQTVSHGIKFMDSQVFPGMTVQSLVNFIFGALETLAVYSVFLIMIVKYKKKKEGLHENA